MRLGCKRQLIQKCGRENLLEKVNWEDRDGDGRITLTLILDKRFIQYFS
jgi:hypothetical protein